MPIRDMPATASAPIANASARIGPSSRTGDDVAGGTTRGAIEVSRNLMGRGDDARTPGTEMTGGGVGGETACVWRGAAVRAVDRGRVVVARREGAAGVLDGFACGAGGGAPARSGVGVDADAPAGARSGVGEAVAATADPPTVTRATAVRQIARPQSRGGNTPKKNPHVPCVIHRET